MSLLLTFKKNAMNIASLTPLPNDKLTFASKSAEPEPFWGKDGFNFADLVDMFNPLQHLPVVSKYYREQTHDDASEGSRLFGGLLFGGLTGGVAGMVTSAANSALRHETQQDMGEQLLALAEDSLEELMDFSENASTGSLSLAEMNKNTGENPFFAQMFEENLSEPLYSPQFENASVTNPRIHNWGKV